LYLINKLCTQYGKDETVTTALDTRAFYLVPRLNPDGAEWALADTPKFIRSSTRPYPFDEDDPYGLENMDVDGDGRVLSMRIQDDNGPWKISDVEPRLMVRRDPGDRGGKYYRIVKEGTFENFDGLTMRARKTKEGLDLNRNFPSAWRLEDEQHGAGPFPTSEPEVHAAVKAISDHPNICGAVTFHTFSGVHLRPPSRMPDDEIPAEDLWTYKAFGKKGEDLTGYPAISNFHEFKYHPKEIITGVFDDWAYEHRGIFAWTTEIWSPQRQAGITEYKYIEWFRDHPFSDDQLMLRWSDDKLDGKGYIDWYKFNHPQLGEIELGGWDPIYAFRNPPPQFLEAEIAPHSDWVIWQALSSPCLALRQVEVEKFGDAWRIRVAVQNTGYLPTEVSQIAAKKKLCRGVSALITSEGEAKDWIVSGRLRQDIGQLSGWSHVASSGFGWSQNGTEDIGVFEWVVSKPGSYEVVASHERAGTVRTTVVV
ncbi:MAG: carboxypeptidase, partial [Armatimonadetes bacterium]|nr:carboxypeptidase [Armatimonadota bacterium]